MAVRDRDRAVYLDALALLAGLQGDAARDLESHHEALLDDLHVVRQATNAADDASRSDLANECDQRIETALHELKELASTIPSNTLLSIPLLLGQADFRRELISPGPNAFDFEIGLLMSYASSPPDSPDRKSAVATLQCMAIARSIRLLRWVSLWTRPARSPLGQSLAIGGLSERGRFSGYYDLQVADLIAGRLRERGLEADPPRGLRRILETFLTAWAKTSFAFLDACRSSRSQLAGWLTCPQLLVQPNWTPADLELVAQHFPDMWLERALLPADLALWISKLSALIPSDSAPPSAFDLAHMSREPFVHFDDQVLLVRPHRLDTDLTEVTNSVWGEAYGATYYSVRGEVVEQVAFSTLMRLPGAQGVQGGSYMSSSGRVQGECDGVVLWEGHLFLIEAKGGFLSLAARRGNSEAATNDVRHSVGEAFYQATRLMLLLEDEGCVELSDRCGHRLELNRLEIVRAHVLIPTADDFGNIAVLPNAMEDAGVLPAGGIPLVAAGQELLLFSDILADPLDLLAYMHFREEVLTHRPEISLADEHEILGGYVAGVDFVALSRHYLRQLGDGSLVPDPVLQQHIDKWLQERYFAIEADITPPRRHGSKIVEYAHQLYRQGDLESALTILQSSRDAAAHAAGRVAPHVGRTPALSVDSEVAVVTTLSEAPIRVLRNKIDWSAATRSRQIWIFKRYSRDDPILLRAFKPANTKANVNRLMPTIKGDDLRRWYDKVDARRRRGYDEAVVAALEQQGLPPSTGIGVCRLGLVPHVLAAVTHGANIQKAAALWMGPLKQLALSRGVAVSALNIDPAHVVSALNLLVLGALRRDELWNALEAAIDNRVSPAEYAGRRQCGPLSEAESADGDLARLAAEVIDAQPDVAARAARGDDKAIKYLVGLVMKYSTPPRPSHGDVGSALTKILGGQTRSPA